MSDNPEELMAADAGAGSPSHTHIHHSSSMKSLKRADSNVMHAAEERAEQGVRQGALFGNVQKVKNDAADELLHSKSYDVSQFYHEEGLIPKIARSDAFNNITLGVISINAVWMGIDTDLNDAETLAAAQIHFQIAEHFFAVFFTSELLIRFLAFEKKLDTMKDGWFKFDSILCLLMIFETWVFPLAFTGAPPDTSFLRLLRLLRLSRMMRLLRRFPELLTLLKGMAAAVRSVFSTLVLLVVFMYVFAIIFRQQSKGNEALEAYFGSMGLCFWTLLLQGTLLDDITDALTEIKDDTPAMAALFLVFVLLGNFTVLNMLIGVLCEVVSAVSEGEQEKMHVQYAKDCFIEVLHEMDVDGSGTLTQDEFEVFCKHPVTIKALEELDVDQQGLLSLSDVIFEADEDTEATTNANVSRSGLDDCDEQSERKSLKFAQVIRAILDLRNSNTAMVKDIVSLRKFMRGSQRQMHDDIKELSKQMRHLVGNGNAQRVYSKGSSDDHETTFAKGISHHGRQSPDQPNTIKPRANGDVDAQQKILELVKDAKQAVQDAVFHGCLKEKNALMKQALALVDMLEKVGTEPSSAQESLKEPQHKSPQHKDPQHKSPPPCKNPEAQESFKAHTSDSTWQEYLTRDSTMHTAPAPPSIAGDSDPGSLSEFRLEDPLNESRRALSSRVSSPYPTSRSGNSTPRLPTEEFPVRNRPFNHNSALRVPRPRLNSKGSAGSGDSPRPLGTSAQPRNVVMWS